MEERTSSGGILGQFKISNFRCHEKTPDIELAPITLLVGPNSSGKTALIQPLLLLKQTLEPKAPLVTPVILNGNYVELGTYNEIIHDHKSQKNLEIEIRIKIPIKLLKHPVIRMGSILRRVLQKLPTELDVTWTVRIGYSRKQQRMILLATHLCSEIFAFHIFPPKRTIEAQIFDFKFKQVESKYLSEQNLRTLLNTLPIVIRSALYEGERMKNAARMRFEYYYLIKIIFETILATIDKLGYIGPIRQYPSRYYVSSGERVSDVGNTGEDAFEVLYQDMVLGGELTDQLKYWLKKLEVAEGIEIKPIDPYLFSFEILSPYKKTPVNITGTGFGVSQIIPAIIQGHLMAENSTLILEQPEIHLHPKAQATVADLLIDLTKKNKRFIVETHSEHMILRLQRRVAEKSIDSDKIKMYYFDMSTEGPSIKTISINSKGELLNFPAGFMEEGFKEAYRMALAASSDRS